MSDCRAKLYCDCKEPGAGRVLRSVLVIGLWFADGETDVLIPEALYNLCRECSGSVRFIDAAVASKDRTRGRLWLEARIVSTDRTDNGLRLVRQGNSAKVAQA